jgi:transcriptional regulator GlxA family with amidase domain
MKQVCFLLPEGIVKPSSMMAAMEIFEVANDFLTEKGMAPYYDIRIIGISQKQLLHHSQFSIEPSVQDYKKLSPDLIIVPGLHWHNNYSIKENSGVLKWMVARYARGCELASLCTGAFFLAATGLLKGMECSTHWKGEELFLKMYPDVKLCTDKIITDNKGIYTAGGANSSLNLILYLIEKYNGREAAVYCSKVLQIDIERSSQSPFMLFSGQKDHSDEEIRKVQQFIEKNIDERMTVEFLAGKFIMSKRSFIRRFKKATNNAPNEYIQKVKIEAAKRSLEQERKNVNEVMYAVGYNDVKAFRTIFKKVTGLTPFEYRAKFSQVSLATR